MILSTAEKGSRRTHTYTHQRSNIHISYKRIKAVGRALQNGNKPQQRLVLANLENVGQRPITGKRAAARGRQK